MFLLEQMPVLSRFVQINVGKNKEEGTKALVVSVGIGLMSWLLYILEGLFCKQTT